MKKTKTESLCDVLGQMLDNSKTGTKMKENEAVNMWSDVVDPKIAARTERVTVYKGVLTVFSYSAAVKSEILARKSQIIKDINDKLGARVITDIFLR